ncbi:hypothetical protein [Parasitella parasitica]|uniref:RING-type domain-containing protein n=1 Tax=Parasitella parasitica TaxID=35722 RepID=A0A0B7MTS9_9FUNG|nr:hypothetical protein [Parasitella parasitica]
MQAVVVSFEASHSLDALRKSLNVPTECPICCTRFTNATTTPCGHVFCRNCLVRSLDHQRSCPFCRDNLEFCPPPTKILVDLLSRLFAGVDDDDETDDALGLDPNFESEHRVPLLIGSMSFPHVNCAIHVFEPRYRLMLRRIMASSRRRFAMCLARRKRSEGQPPFFEYGTILELMHVQTLPDGRSIVEAVGSHRFRVTNFELTDGYHMADIERIDDIDREQEHLLEQQQILRASALRARQAQQQQQQQPQQPQQQQPLPPAPAAAIANQPMSARPRSMMPARPMSTSVARPMMARPMMARPMMARSSVNAFRPQQQQQQQQQQQLMGQRRSWAQQAHPQTQPQASRAPWQQIHVQGLSAARPKPHMVPQRPQQTPQQQQPSIIPEKVVKNRQEQSTDEILDELATFIEKLMNHKTQNPGDGMSSWLGALGNPPTLRGPQRDRVIFTWWVVNLMPLGEEEKLPLLAMRTVRERVLTIVSWVDRFEDQWSLFLNNSATSSSNPAQPPVSCCIS